MVRMSRMQSIWAWRQRVDAMLAASMTAVGPRKHCAFDGFLLALNLRCYLSSGCDVQQTRAYKANSARCSR